MARTIRAVRILLRDHRIPRPVRWLAGFAVLPIPGPIDEVALLIVAPWLFLFRRDAMREAWRRAGA